MHVLFHTPWHLSKRKIESRLTKTSSRWPIQTKNFKPDYYWGRDLVLWLWPRNQATDFWVCWSDIPSAEKLKFQRYCIKTMLIIFFDSQGVVSKEFVPEGKTVNAEFYKGVMDRLLKRIQRVRPAAFCSRDFFCCTIMLPPTKLQVFANFWPKKCYNPLSPFVFSIFTSARLFSIPQVENKVKRTPLCRCCWDPRSRNWWIKEDPKKRKFRQLFRNCTTAQKPVYMPMELILNKNKSIFLPHVSPVFKKISPKTFEPHCLCCMIWGSYAPISSYFII